MTINAKEIFTTVSSNGLSLLANYGPYLFPLVTFLLGWKIKNQSADRQFLRNDIYSPLYEDIRQMAKNISDFENSYSKFGVVSSQIGKVRRSLINRGKYSLIPKNLQKDIDSYYEGCEEYNKKLNSARREISNICITETKKLKTEEDHEKFLKCADESKKNRHVSCMNSISHPQLLLKGIMPDHVSELNDHLMFSLTNNSKWDSIITIDDLKKNSISFEDLLKQLIELVGKNDTVIGFRELQKQFNHPVKLLQKLEKRIQNPNPRIEKLGI